MGIRKIEFAFEELAIFALICLLLVFILGVSAIFILVVLPLLIVYLFLNIFVRNSRLRKIIWIGFIVVLIYLLIRKVF